MNKNKMILGVFALVSVLAIALGFAAAFGEVTGPATTHVKDEFDKIANYDQATKDVMVNIIPHINFAWIGGIITGVLGILGLGTAGFMMFKGIELNKTLMIVVIAAVVTMFALAIAAIVTQGQLNSETWVKENIVMPTAPATTV